MKIDIVNIGSTTGAGRIEPAAKPKSDAVQQTEATQAVRTDRVELSTRKSEIERLKQAAEAMPDVRTEKVAALKQQISEGTYAVGGVKVAAKMLDQSKGSGGTGGSR